MDSTDGSESEFNQEALLPNQTTSIITVSLELNEIYGFPALLESSEAFNFRIGYSSLRLRLANFS